MSLYQHNTTRFLCEFATSPGADYTAVTAFPGDTAGRISWWRSRCVDAVLGQGTEWHPSLSASAENAWGISDDGVNVLPSEYAPVVGSIDANNPPTYWNLLGLYDNADTSLFGVNTIQCLNSGADVNERAYFGATATDYNFTITPYSRWIISCYVRPFIAGANTFTLGIRTNASGTHRDGGVLTSGSAVNKWVRVSTEIDLSTDSSTSAILNVKVGAVGTSGAVVLDGLMLAKKVGYTNSPSTFSPGVG